MRCRMVDFGVRGPVVANSDGYDELDRQLVHALHIDGRAPMSTLAAVLGVSDKTLARRYARLRACGALRVVGAVDPFAVAGQVVWLVRIRCVPSASEAVAEALARRPDTLWVSLTSGGTEITCLVQPEHESDGDTLLLQQLPRTSRIESVTAHYLLHRFITRTEGLVTKQGPLTADQVAALHPEVTPGAPTVLEATDRALLAVLASDGRAGFAELSAASGLSASAVRRRLHQLRTSGTLYYEIEFDWRILGIGIRTLLWLACEPARIAAIGRELATHPEIAFAGATTGPTTIFASVYSRDQQALYAYLTERLANLPGLLSLESAPVVRTVKQIVQPGAAPRGYPSSSSR